MNFWDAIDQLVHDSQPIIDRPQHSAHHRFPDMRYPLDYGYLAGTTGGDGDGIDIWLGSGNHRQPTGVICTADIQKRDAEIKILLGCTTDEMRMILNFLTEHQIGCTLIERPSNRAEDEPYGRS